MTFEEIIKYHVTVEDGSGCLFQPIGAGDKYSYILTAKHLFEGKRKARNGREESWVKSDGDEIKIFRTINDQGQGTEMEIKFTFNMGENYFAHPMADAAILKIDHLKDIGNIIISSTDDKTEGYSVYGYPNRLRENKPGNRQTSFKVQEVISVANYSRTAQLISTSLNHGDIEGMSGGAIAKSDSHYLQLLGIQSETKHAYFANGQINFVPMCYFEEIIIAFPNHLSHLLPPYFSTFSFLDNEIFNIKFGVYTKANADHLTLILRKKAEFLKNSNLTPLFVREFLKKELPKLYQADSETLSKKKVWTIWLELLTILHIANRKCNNAKDFNTVSRKVRLFYSDSDEDFWTAHLAELSSRDYSNLDKNAVIVVASNVDAGDKAHLLDLNRVPEDISMVKRSRIKHELEQEGNDTAVATTFPLDTYKFMNISLFKSGTVDSLDTGFNQEKISTCLTLLAQIYGEHLPNW